MAEICTMVVLSTGTLTREVSDMLDEMGEDVDAHRCFGDWRTGLTRCGHGCGHFIRVPTVDPGDDPLEIRIAEYPECLRNGFRHAHQYGAKWIHYDRDADAQGLPEYDW